MVLTKKILECCLMFPVYSLALPKEEERKEAIEALVDLFLSAQPENDVMTHDKMCEKRGNV